MMEQKPETNSKPKVKKAGLVCLLAAAVIALCAATGIVCWQIRDHQAQMEVEQTN